MTVFLDCHLLALYIFAGSVPTDLFIVTFSPPSCSFLELRFTCAKIPDFLSDIKQKGDVLEILIDSGVWCLGARGRKLGF